MGSIKDKGRQLHQIKRVPYEDAFLTTILSGEPKAGKTLLSAGMGIALLNGEPTFLGLPVLRKLDHIVFGVTDDGAPEELKERLHGAVPDHAVTVFPVEDPGDPDYRAGISADLADMRPGLLVLDNIIGALAPGEDIAVLPDVVRPAPHRHRSQLPVSGVDGEGPGVPARSWSSVFRSHRAPSRSAVFRKAMVSRAAGLT